MVNFSDVSEVIVLFLSVFCTAFGAGYIMGIIPIILIWASMLASVAFMCLIMGLAAPGGSKLAANVFIFLPPVCFIVGLALGLWSHYRIFLRMQKLLNFWRTLFLDVCIMLVLYYFFVTLFPLLLR